MKISNVNRTTIKLMSLKECTILSGNVASVTRVGVSGQSVDGLYSVFLAVPKIL